MESIGRDIRSAVILLAAFLVPIDRIDAQLMTVGAGALLSDRPAEPVLELHGASPPIFRTRAYATLSWTDDSGSPTVITAAERTVLQHRRAIVGLGAGLLWLEGNDYRPYPIIVNSTVVPLTLPRTSIVVIASTQPFQEFEWSVVLKAAVALWFAR